MGINLLPSRTQKRLNSHITSGKSKANILRPSPTKIPPKSLFPAAILISTAIMGSAFFFTQTLAKEKQLASLDRQLLNEQNHFNKITELSGKKKELEDALISYNKKYQSRISWPEKLSFLGKSLPRQIWLTSIETVENQGIKSINIKGSCTSLLSNEIIDSISLFAESLRKDNTFSKDFEEIRLGQMRSEKESNPSVMSFSLDCRLKP